MTRIPLLLFLFFCLGCPDNIPIGPIPCQGGDSDGDGVQLNCDNCPDTFNEDQSDVDHDGIGDLCDNDMDNDGVDNEDDLCPKILDPKNEDSDDDGVGDVCDFCDQGEEDSDGDGIPDCKDTCPDIKDKSNSDKDGDGIGDACDLCPKVPDTHQNSTGGKGDSCHNNPFTIQELTISALHKALKNGTQTCESVTEMFLQHIAEHDLSIRDGAPPRNTFVSFNEKIRTQARKLDQQQKDTGLLPLHCVPFVIKTNYEAPEVETTGGTQALAGTYSPTNSASVERLRHAGALLIGSTSMDELARGTDGISSRSGRTGNAYDPTLYSGGSSAGSGVAVGSNFSIFGLGTDNCASLLLPASLNGLTSFRSTHQLIELDGMFPSGLTDGVAGPMARSVEDLAQVMDFMVAKEKPDSVSRANWSRPESYKDHLIEDGLRGKRIGILRKLSESTAEYYKHPFKRERIYNEIAWKKVMSLMKSEGATIIENVTLPRFDSSRGGGGFPEEMEKWFKRVNSPVDDIAGMCKNETYSAFVWDDKNDCSQAMEPDDGLARAAKNRRRFYQNATYVEKVMDLLEIDVLLYPTTLYGEANGWGGRVNCLLGSTTGMPSLTFITSIGSHNRPFGMTITGRNFDEATLFEIAYALEKRTPSRTKPSFDNPEGIPKLDLKDANEIRREIGESSSALFRKESKSYLTPNRMRNLVEPILKKHNQMKLIE